MIPIPVATACCAGLLALAVVLMVVAFLVGVEKGRAS